MSWKLLPKPLLPLESGSEVVILSAIVVTLLLLCIAAAVLISRKTNLGAARRIVQSVSLVLLGIVFIQCHCIGKQIVWGFQYLSKGKLADFAIWFWYPLMVVLFVLFFGRRLYCYWMCPTGFVQDIVGKVHAWKKGLFGPQTLRQVNLWSAVVLGVAMAAIAWFFRPSDPVLAIGGWLGVATLVVLIPVCAFPRSSRWLLKLKYLSLILWVLIPIVGLKVAGPWCVAAQALLVYSASVSFACVLLASMIMPRAWCRYLCPDGAILQLASNKLARRGSEQPPTAESPDSDAG